MMRTLSVLLFLATVCCCSCQTYVTSDNRKHRQLFPPKDKRGIASLDTTKYIRLPFNVADHTNRTTHKNGKRIVEIISASDVHTLAASKKRYLIYFWNPACLHTLNSIHILDSCLQKGENVLVVSLRNTPDIMDSRLQKTTFSQYPLLIVNSENYSKRLPVRKIRFIREACENCYQQHKDDLAVADYLLLKYGAITPIMYNNGESVLSR